MSGIDQFSESPAGPRADYNDIALVIASRDLSRELWSPLLDSFWKCWPDCPFRIFLVTNHAGDNDSRAQTIRVGSDHSWSDTLARALPQVPHKYVLLWIDDHFLIRRVDTASVLKILNGFRTAGGNYIRLNALPRPSAPFTDLFGTVAAGEVYRTATVASVWRKDVLLALLRPGESAWEFEIDGSVRSDRFGGFYGVWRDCFKIENLLIKSKLRRLGVWRIRRALGKRVHLSWPLMSIAEETGLYMAILRNRLLIRLPSRTARALQAILARRRGGPAIPRNHSVGSAS